MVEEVEVHSSAVEPLPLCANENNGEKEELPAELSGINLNMS